MSSSLSDNLALLNAGKEENIFWVDTYYFNLEPYTIEDTFYRGVRVSGRKSPKDYGMVLEFRFARTDKMVLKLTCIRTPVTLPPSKYRLEFDCSVNVFDQDPIVLVLESDKKQVFQAYDLNSSIQFCVTPNGHRTVLEVKIAVKMIKYDIDSSPESNIHIEEEFTGRQTDEFANLKTTYITRAAKFSSEIAEYKKAKEARDHLPSTDFGPILNYILKGEQKPIDDQDVFEIYFEAHRMGLSFLVLLSRHAIRERIGNQSFLIEALGAADRVGDQYLLMKLAKKYHTIETEQLNPEDAGKLTGSTIEWKFMLQSLNRQLKKKQLKKQVEIGESSKSFTAISPSK